MGGVSVGNAVVPIENGLHFFLSWSPATEFFPFLFEVLISLSALWRHNSHTIKSTILRGKTQCLQASRSIKLPPASYSAFRTINHPKKSGPCLGLTFSPTPGPIPKGISRSSFRNTHLFSFLPSSLPLFSSSFPSPSSSFHFL